MSEQPSAPENRIRNPIRWRRVGWAACLGLLAVLVIGNWRVVGGSLRQAQGVRGLMQAGASLSSDELANPFACLRAAGEAALAQRAVENVSDGYLRGVGLCMAGEPEAGLVALLAAGSHAGAQVQYTAGSITDAQARVQALMDLDLPQDDLVEVLHALINQPDIEPYPALRLLAREVNDQPDTWWLWLQGAARLTDKKEWQAALDWMKEGLMIAPAKVQGSLSRETGWITLRLENPPDYHAALAYFNQALDGGGWLYAGDEAYALLLRGEVYRALKDEFTPQQALQEFQAGLAILPGNYWALLDIGYVYLYDLKDLDQAEEYYRRAQEGDGQQPYAYYYLGEVSLARGDTQAAVEWYRKALGKQPDLQAALDRLAELGVK